MNGWLVSADSHVVEPPDLWTVRLPAALRDRAPRVERADDGTDVWVVEGQAPVSLAGIAPTGSELRDMRSGARSELAAFLPGFTDPVARLELQRRCGVGTEVLYPYPQLADATKAIADPELRLACTRAYNDWIAEFTATAPDRLVGLGRIPTTSFDDAMAELERCGRQLGLRGVVLDAWPRGRLPTEEDEPFWALVADLDVPVSVHRALGNRPTGVEPTLLPPRGAPSPVMPLAESGLLDRHPSVKLVLAHADCGWVPGLIEGSDVSYLRLRSTRATPLPDPDRMPSDYLRRHGWYTFANDRVGVLNRDVIGDAHLMWASHLPLAGCDFPDEAQRADLVTQGVPDEVAARLLGGNCARLYRLPGFEAGFTDDEITRNSGSLLLL